MEMHTNTQKEDVSIEKEFHKQLSNITWKNVVIYQGKYKNVLVNVIRTSVSIRFNIMLMFITTVLKRVVIQPSLPHLRFVDHTLNPMECVV